MTGTSSPSAHSSFSTVPDAVLGTSVAALSVSTSQRMSFSAMVSPSLTDQDTMRQDSTLFPRAGMTMTVAIRFPLDDANVGVFLEGLHGIVGETGVGDDARDGIQRQEGDEPRLPELAGVGHQPGLFGTLPHGGGHLRTLDETRRQPAFG